MRAICNTETFGRKLQLVSRGVSARSTIQLLGGILLEAGGEASKAIGDGHGDLDPDLFAGGGRGRRARGHTGAHLQRHREVAAGRELLAGARRLGGDGQARGRGERVPHQDLCGRRLPAAARLSGGGHLQDVRGVARGDRGESVAVVLAGRDQAGA